MSENSGVQFVSLEVRFSLVEAVRPRSEFSAGEGLDHHVFCEEIGLS